MLALWYYSLTSVVLLNLVWAKQIITLIYCGIDWALGLMIIDIIQNQQNLCSFSPKHMNGLTSYCHLSYVVEVQNSSNRSNLWKTQLNCLFLWRVVVLRHWCGTMRSGHGIDNAKKQTLLCPTLFSLQFSSTEMLIHLLFSITTPLPPPMKLACVPGWS